MSNQRSNPVYSDQFLEHWGNVFVRMKMKEVVTFEAFLRAPEHYMRLHWPWLREAQTEDALHEAISRLKPLTGNLVEGELPFLGECELAEPTSGTGNVVAFRKPTAKAKPVKSTKKPRRQVSLAETLEQLSLLDLAGDQS